MKIKLTLEAKLNGLLLLVVIMCVVVTSLLNYWFNSILLAATCALAILFPLSVTIFRRVMKPINQVIGALNNGFHNFLDNDFSVSLVNSRNDEVGDLIGVFNRVGQALRDERLHLYQRELLLDTVIQTTPLSLILTDDSDAIIYSNSAARQLLLEGKAINGSNFKALLENKPNPFVRAVNSGLSGLFTVVINDTNETYHLTQNQFLLNGRTHRLYLFKSLTKEIDRQEVNTWKKVIRLISHELNNSLAPISSLAHSGQLLCQRQSDEKLEKIFRTIQERARHLQYFIEGYAKFARLPRPIIQAVDIKDFLAGLLQIKKFSLECKFDGVAIHCDPAQMQQVIINLLKNAHESGTQHQQVKLRLVATEDTFEIHISDRGKGMSESNLSKALLPFYSTKANGTGLGLPLCREIVEAHGGKMLIANRQDGGLIVSLIMPNKAPADL